MAVAATDYMTIEEGRTTAGLESDDSSEDTEIELFISAATEFVERYCNRKFAYVDGEVEKFVGPRHPRPPYFYCSRTPVISVTSIVDTEPDTPETLTSGTDYELEEADIGAVRFLKRLENTATPHGRIRVQPARGSYKKRYTITYEGGFETPNQSGTGATSLPGLIRMATRMVFKNMYSNRNRDMMITREHLLRGSFWYGAEGFERSLETYLDLYRRIAQA